MPVGFGCRLRAPFLVLKMKRDRAACVAFEEQFPEALDLIARALKAGTPLRPELKMVADEMEDPSVRSSARPSTSRTSGCR